MNTEQNSDNSEKALRIGSVSQQRELLLAFAKHQSDWGNTNLTKEMHEIAKL